MIQDIQDRVRMRQTAIGFESKKKVNLAGILTTPDELPGPYPVLLLCHPHPMLNGNMDHPVISAIVSLADNQGFATLRFNFRGVGDSEGSFSNGEGEQDDVRAALKVLRVWPGLDKNRIGVVGYSFGASVILRGLKHYKAAKTIALIAPPISYLQKSKILNDKRPRLFVGGTNDRVSPSLDVQRALDTARQPVQFQEIPDADHSLRNYEHIVAGHVVDFAGTTL